MELFILTGCTSGLGLSLHENFKEYVSASSKLLFLGRNLERLEKNDAAEYLDVDFSKNIDWSKLVTFIQEGITKITLIHNAGVVWPIEQVGNLDMEAFSTSQQVNFITPVALVNELCAVSLQKSLELRIFNVSSGAAINPVDGWGAYCSGKSAIRMFLDVLQCEQENVEVMHFDPGVLDTNMQADIRSSDTTSMKAVIIFVNAPKRLIY